MRMILMLAAALACAACSDADLEAANGAGDGIGDGLSRAAQDYNQSRRAAAPIYTNCQRTGNMVNCTSF